MITHTVDHYANLIDHSRPFTQANYGDGEWQCILGYEGQNAQGGNYTPQLRAALQETISKPHRRGDYWYGTNPGKKMADEVERWIHKYSSDPTVHWVWKETLAAANVRGELAPVIQALRRRRMMIVGPPHLRYLPERGVLYPNAFVEVPSVNAFTDIDRIVAEITEQAAKHRIKAICFSAGMAAKVMIHRLHPTLGQDTILLDCGAIWDPYVGKLSRKGYRKPDILNRLARNSIDGRPHDDMVLDLALGHIAGRRRELRDGPLDARLERAYETRYRVAVKVEPQSICEIGVRAGYYAYIMLAAAPAATYYGIDKNLGDWGGKINYYKHAEEFLARFDATINVTDSQRLTALPQSYDLIHIDGDHSYEGCKHDLTLCLPHANRALAVDDYHNLRGVRQACDEFAQQHPELKTEVLNDGGYRGCFVVWL